MTSTADPVPFFSMEAANRGIDPLAAVARVVRRGRYVLGEEVDAFERAFAAYCGTPNCISVANGTDALELALRAAGVGPGDKVMLAANAGYYGSTAVNLVGATAVYVDVDAATLTLCPDRLADAATQHAAKAVIATHLYGQLAAIERIVDWGRANSVIVIEDCAQAHGAERGGRKAGSFGDMGCFSFYPTKNLGALGDGGAVTCRDEAIAARLRSLRQYGWSSKYRNDMAGGRNSRLDELQAAILNDKLPGLDKDNRERREAARYYQSGLAGLPLQLPCSVEGDSVAHLYVVRAAEREALRAFLAQRGIATDVHYPLADHLQQAARLSASEVAGDLRQSEAACATVLSLPCYPGIPREHQQAVVAAVRGFFER